MTDPRRLVPVFTNSVTYPSRKLRQLRELGASNEVLFAPNSRNRRNSRLLVIRDGYSEMQHLADDCLGSRRAVAIGAGRPTVGYYAVKRARKTQVEVTKKLFSVEDYYRMAEVGILSVDDRFELIDGEIIQVSPIGARHAGCVKWASHVFNVSLTGRAVVSVQDPLRLSSCTEPRPDIALLKWCEDFYRNRQAQADDALLVVEVADTTLKYDSEVKVPHYAAAGIPEVWIVDLQHNQLLVFRDPEVNRFKVALTLNRSDSISVLAFPELRITVDEILG